MLRIEPKPCLVVPVLTSAARSFVLVFACAFWCLCFQSRSGSAYSPVEGWNSCGLCTLHGFSVFCVILRLPACLTPPVAPRSFSQVLWGVFNACIEMWPSLARQERTLRVVVLCVLWLDCVFVCMLLLSCRDGCLHASLQPFCVSSYKIICVALPLPVFSRVFRCPSCGFHRYVTARREEEAESARLQVPDDVAV